MNIFISWSGERSHKVAELLNDWIQCVIQAVDPWLSSRDIDKGTVWFSELTDQIEKTNNGIICLTKANLNKPWILFEAGALAKGLQTNRVFTFLIDLEAHDVKDPLAQFNHTSPNRNDLYRLIISINNGLGDRALKTDVLRKVFETYWPQFEKDFKEILKNTKEEEIKEQRPQKDILTEILYAVRGLERRISKIELKEVNHKDFIYGMKSKKDDKINSNSTIGSFSKEDFIVNDIVNAKNNGIPISDLKIILEKGYKLKINNIIEYLEENYPFYFDEF